MSSGLADRLKVSFGLTLYVVTQVYPIRKSHLIVKKPASPAA